VTELAVRALEGQVQCGAKFSHSCVCVLPPHDPAGPHECDPATCGGSWRYDDDGQVRIVRLPTPAGAADGPPRWTQWLRDAWPDGQRIRRPRGYLREALDSIDIAGAMQQAAAAVTARMRESGELPDGYEVAFDTTGLLEREQR